MSQMMTDERYVTVPEAADLLDMDGGDLYVAIFEGRVRAKPTLERGVLVPVEEIERLLRTRDETATEG